MPEKNQRLNPAYVVKKVTDNPFFIFPSAAVLTLGGALLTGAPVIYMTMEDADTIGSADAQTQADITQEFQNNLHDMERMQLDISLLKAQDKRAEFDGLDTAEIDAEHDALVETFEYTAHNTYGMLMAGNDDGAFLSEEHSKSLFTAFSKVQDPANLGYDTNINIAVLDECLLKSPETSNTNNIITTVEHNKNVNACMASEAGSDDKIGSIAVGTGLFGGFALTIFMLLSLTERFRHTPKYIPAKPKNKHIKHNH